MAKRDNAQPARSHQLVSNRATSAPVRRSDATMSLMAQRGTRLRLDALGSVTRNDRRIRRVADFNAWLAQPSGALGSDAAAR